MAYTVIGTGLVFDRNDNEVFSEGTAITNTLASAKRLGEGMLRDNPEYSTIQIHPDGSNTEWVLERDGEWVKF